MEPRMGRSSTSGSSDKNIAGLYDMEKTLGSGHFAVVKLARHVFTGEKVAVKVIDKTKLDEKAKAHLYQEVRCMKLVQHPNVVRLYEVIDTQTKLYLILEFGDGGDMYDYIMKHEGHGISEEKAKLYFHQIVSAIDYCHKLHVVHRDLKPENVIFFKNLDVAKLTDFGFSNSFLPGEKLYTSCGSLAYSAPEILLGDSYDAPAVDVWSLGVILYMMVCGSGPFSHANDSETLTMIMDCKYEMPPHLSAECQSLISRMLVRDPKQRATLDLIAADPWLNGCDLSVVPPPLISELHVTPAMHLSVIQKMEGGTIATRDEIKRSLEDNQYDHVTATYFLLSERLMRKRYGNGPTLNTRPNLHTKLQARHSSPLRDTDENRNTRVVATTDMLAEKSPLASPVRTRRTASLCITHLSKDDNSRPDNVDDDDDYRLTDESKEKSHSEELLSDKQATGGVSGGLVDFSRFSKHSKAHRVSYPVYKKTQSSPNLLNGISEECDSEGEESPRNSPRNSKRSVSRRRKFQHQRHAGCRLSPIHSRRSSCSSSDDDEKLEMRRGNFVNRVTASIMSYKNDGSTTDPTASDSRGGQQGRKAADSPPSGKDDAAQSVESLSLFLMKNREFPERILSDSNLMTYIASRSHVRYSMHRQKKCPSDTDLMNLRNRHHHHNHRQCIALSAEVRDKLSLVAMASHMGGLATRIEEENPGDVSPTESPRQRESDDSVGRSSLTQDSSYCESDCSSVPSRQISADFCKAQLRWHRESRGHAASVDTLPTSEWNNNSSESQGGLKHPTRRSQSDVPLRMCFLKQLTSSLVKRTGFVNGTCCVLV